MYRNSQIDVNIYYFPSTFLPFFLEDKEKKPSNQATPSKQL